MSDPTHLALLRGGIETWNQWRADNPCVSPDLSRAELQGSNLYEADLHGTNLSDVRLKDATLTRANLRDSNLNGALINDARAWYANFCDCKMRGAYLWGTDFREADFSRADLTEANLCNTQLVMTKFRSATLIRCKIYGIAAWDIDLESANQANLIVSAPNQPNQITVGDLEVGQFIYLILNNSKLRKVIDTIGRKGVLLLGRFTGGRIAVLERLQDELRSRDYMPIVFNFEKPETKDFTETVRLLAGLSRFVIVDITNPRSSPLELQATVPECSVPFIPILQKDEEPFSMFRDLWCKYSWVMDPIRYPSVDRLVQALDTEIIGPAETMCTSLLASKTKKLVFKDV